MISNGKNIEDLKKNFITVGEKLGFIVPVPQDNRVKEPTSTSTTPTLLLERARGKLYPMEWLFNPDILSTTSTSPISLLQYTHSHQGQATSELGYIKMMTPLLRDTCTNSSGIRVLFTGYDELTHTDYAVIYSDEKTLGVYLDDLTDTDIDTDIDRDLVKLFDNPFTDPTDSSASHSAPHSAPHSSGYKHLNQDFFMVIHLVPDSKYNFLHWVLIDFNFSVGYRSFVITDDYLNHLYRVVYNTSDYSLPSNRDIEPQVFYNIEGWRLETASKYQPTEDKVITKHRG